MRRPVSSPAFKVFILLSSVVLVALLGSCGEPKPVTIGALIPETGPAAPYGRTIRQGIDIAVADINAKGGVSGGHKLMVEYRDTKTSTSQAQVGFQELLDLHVPAIIGPGTSSVALALIPSINKAKMLMISPSVSSPRLTGEGGQWFFRVYPSDVVEGFRMANFCREMFWTRVAVIASDDPFGQGIADVFTKKYVAGVREVIMRENFKTMDDALIRSLIQKIRKLKPEAVYVAAYVDDVAALLKAMENMPDKPPLLGTSAVTREIVKKAGAAAEGFVFPQVFFDCESPEPEICGFVDKCREKYQEDPDNFAAHAYDAVGVLAAAMDQTPVLNSSDLAGELSRIDFKGVTGEIKFDQNGDVVRAPSLFAVMGGEVVPFEKFKKAKLGQKIFKQ